MHSLTILSFATLACSASIPWFSRHAHHAAVAEPVIRRSENGTVQHCFKDAAGATVCKAVANMHHNQTDIHRQPNGVNDFHNDYKDGHKESVQGKVPGQNVKAAFPTSQSASPSQSQPSPAQTSGTKNNGNTVFEGSYETDDSGLRDTHNEPNGVYEDHKEDNDHNATKYRENSKLADGGQSGTTYQDVHNVHEVNDVQDKNGTTDTFRQGSNDWDTALTNVEKHGKAGGANGRIQDHEAGTQQNGPSPTDSSSFDSQQGGHSDHIFNEKMSVDGTYELHEENNEKDDSRLSISGTNAWGDLKDSWDNFDDVFNSPAFDPPKPPQPSHSASSQTPLPAAHPPPLSATSEVSASTSTQPSTQPSSSSSTASVVPPTSLSTTKSIATSTPAAVPRTNVVENWSGAYGVRSIAKRGLDEEESVLGGQESIHRPVRDQHADYRRLIRAIFQVDSATVAKKAEEYNRLFENDTFNAVCAFVLGIATAVCFVVSTWICFMPWIQWIRVLIRGAEDSEESPATDIEPREGPSTSARMTECTHCGHKAVIDQIEKA